MLTREKPAETDYPDMAHVKTVALSAAEIMNEITAPIIGPEYKWGVFGGIHGFQLRCYKKNAVREGMPKDFFWALKQALKTTGIDERDLIGKKPSPVTLFFEDQSSCNPDLPVPSLIGIEPNNLTDACKTLAWLDNNKSLIRERLQQKLPEIRWQSKLMPSRVPNFLVNILARSAATLRLKP